MSGGEGFLTDSGLSVSSEGSASVSFCVMTVSALEVAVSSVSDDVISPEHEYNVRTINTAMKMHDAAERRLKLECSSPVIVNSRFIIHPDYWFVCRD